MSRDHQIERCRIHYVFLRKATSSPPMVVIKHPWGFGVEAKDGSFYKENCKQTHCAWCVKSEGVLEWKEDTQ